MHKTLEENLALVRGRIAEAARRAGREPSAIELLAVTKTRRPEAAAELVRLGQLDLGENRAEDLAAKVAWFGARGLRARWHFVGHIQRNKARRIVENADVIHSVDSLRLLETLERIADDVGRCPEVYLQVKLHPEDAKSGFDAADVPAALARARASRSLRVVGLMTMAPLVRVDEIQRGDIERGDIERGDIERRDIERSELEQRELALELARDVFARLAQLARELDAGELALRTNAPLLRLSMGMSDDLEVAIEQGSQCVRVGSALFADVPNTEMVA